MQDIRPRGISDAKKKFYQLSIGAVYFSARKLLRHRFQPVSRVANRAGAHPALIADGSPAREGTNHRSEQNQRDIERLRRDNGRLREECIER